MSSSSLLQESESTAADSTGSAVAAELARLGSRSRSGSPADEREEARRGASSRVEESEEASRGVGTPAEERDEATRGVGKPADDVEPSLCTFCQTGREKERFKGVVMRVNVIWIASSKDTP